MDVDAHCAAPGAAFHEARHRLLSRLYKDKQQWTQIVGARDHLPDILPTTPVPIHPNLKGSAGQFVRRSHRGVTLLAAREHAGSVSNGAAAAPGAFLELEGRPFVVAGVHVHDAAVAAARGPAERQKVGGRAGMW